MPRLLPALTCPHCWNEFRPTQIRSIAEHRGLIGDAVAGETEPLRFLPSRYDLKGRAVDPMGTSCTRLACPRCHLEVPAVALGTEQVIISIVGAPSSGKSVLLAATTFTLRSGLVVPGLDFLDADPALNDLTMAHEAALFRSKSPDTPSMLKKSELSGTQLYRTFRSADASWLAPKPQLFTVGRNGVSRILCLYDNAGEHFAPGQDDSRRSRDVQEPVTGHLAVSKVVVFVVDPTQDQRVQEAILPSLTGAGAEAGDVVALGGGNSQVPQDLVLIETANRIRRSRGLNASEPLPVRIVIALTKADLWASTLLRDAGQENPWREGTHPDVSMPKLSTLDRAHHASLRGLSKVMPELIATARALDPGFRLVPVSALGRPPRIVTPGALPHIRPRDIQPAWPAAPMIAALAAAEPTLLPEYATVPSLECAS